MNDNSHEIDRLLRSVFPPAQPTNTELTHTEQAFRSRIQPPPRRSSFSAGWKPRTTLAVVVALTVVIALVGLQLVRPTAATAGLLEIAQAARLVEPADIPAGSFAYTRSDATVLAVVPEDAIGDAGGPLAYLLPAEREIWTGDDGFVQLRTTNHTPIFFRPDDRQRYDAAGLDHIDRVGETMTQTVTGATGILDERDWPTDPDQLRATIRSLTLDPTAEDVLTTAIALIRETQATPALRAAAIEVIAAIDGIELVEATTGTTTFGLTVDSAPRRTYSFTLTNTGSLTVETITLPDGNPDIGIPPGTISTNTRYHPIRIVTNLDTPPP